jgi:hypothetical protein
MENDYVELLEKATKKYIELGAQRDCILMEMEKLKQFMHATYQLLPQEDQAVFTARWKPWMDKTSQANKSLADAIRDALRSSFPKWKTVAGVRDVLQTAGFDFSSYTSNPLASISTTLRRLKEAGQAVSEEIEGVTGYRASQKIMAEKENREAGKRLNFWARAPERK